MCRARRWDGQTGWVSPCWKRKKREKTEKERGQATAGRACREKEKEKKPVDSTKRVLHKTCTARQVKIGRGRKKKKKKKREKERKKKGGVRNRKKILLFLSTLFSPLSLSVCVCWCVRLCFVIARNRTPRKVNFRKKERKKRSYRRILLMFLSFIHNSVSRVDCYTFQLKSVCVI